MRRRLMICFAVALIVLSLRASVERQCPPKQRLSEYGFFNGVLKDQQPAEGIIPYTLSTPLFSDYAEKLRFVLIPEGSAAKYNDSTVFEFPENTVLIKTFFFPVDFRNPAKGRKLIETRLLIHENAQWHAFPYIWNEEQTDAVYDPAGEIRKVKYIDQHGRKKEHDYFIPNQNQCKGCHNKNESLLPLGPSSLQLNHEMMYPSGRENQLLFWQKSGKLAGFKPSEARNVGIVWNDAATGTLDQRARLWLDINCGFCHQPQGPASGSGLHLHMQETDMLRIGINKTPVAAGRGSGDRRFDIVPGKPDESILMFRMESDDPGIMMPELGRSVKHQEGIALIREWIAGMKTK
jgi:uncharacterized repeat protein (TIGR03806 family)